MSVDAERLKVVVREVCAGRAGRPCRYPECSHGCSALDVGIGREVLAALDGMPGPVGPAGVTDKMVSAAFMAWMRAPVKDDRPGDCIRAPMKDYTAARLRAAIEAALAAAAPSPTPEATQGYGSEALTYLRSKVRVRVGAPLGDGHAADCAVHNAPAMEPGPCDCGAEEPPAAPAPAPEATLSALAAKAAWSEEKTSPHLAEYLVAVGDYHRQEERMRYRVAEAIKNAQPQQDISVLRALQDWAAS